NALDCRKHGKNDLERHSGSRSRPGPVHSTGKCLRNGLELRPDLRICVLIRTQAQRRKSCLQFPKLGNVLPNCKQNISYAGPNWDGYAIFVYREAQSVNTTGDRVSLIFGQEDRGFHKLSVNKSPVGVLPITVASVKHCLDQSQQSWLRGETIEAEAAIRLRPEEFRTIVWTKHFPFAVSQELHPRLLPVAEFGNL